MLSVSRINSVNHAMNYYEHDNYYSKEKEEGREFTEWYGQASEELGLKGNVRHHDFNKILNGHSLNGEKLLKGKEKEQKISFEMFFKFQKDIAETINECLVEEKNKESIKEIINEFASSRDKISTEVFSKYEKKINSIVNSDSNLDIENKMELKSKIKKSISIYKKSVSRRPAFDLTFSAPKSVSIAALVNEDSELIKAHREAVKYALSIVESEYSRVTSIDKNLNKRINENSGKISAALFEHDTSRKLDPQLHTHCVIMNMTKHNEEWRAINSDGFFYNSKKIGAIYQNKLALLVKELGYDIKLNSNGTFDINGYTEEQLKYFSKRSEQIKELGATNQKEATKLVKINRDKKKVMNLFLKKN
ncbi:MobF family relaxase [Silvanigrella aquatica]|uniref:TrwC relaxase domain-containing protein n=1 Tax=Silvanigrella aquatica TaxID=1915309 RepID=A0A1L4D502_9BACT|nr:MobF family relaxase [Silvanigrella aquatica]APJ05269.1 hypothetical protein AXG55_14705 [Silvanigrella aquatica]